jgi:hypothetical protein
MTNPVTSTSVATNGADEAAGSNPNRLCFAIIPTVCESPRKVLIVD